MEVTLINKITTSTSTSIDNISNNKQKISHSKIMFNPNIQATTSAINYLCLSNMGKLFSYTLEKNPNISKQSAKNYYKCSVVHS